MDGESVVPFCIKIIITIVTLIQWLFCVKYCSQPFAYINSQCSQQHYVYYYLILQVKNQRHRRLHNFSVVKMNGSLIFLCLFFPVSRRWRKLTTYWLNIKHVKIGEKLEYFCILNSLVELLQWHTLCLVKEVNLFPILLPSMIFIDMKVPFV